MFDIQYKELSIKYLTVREISHEFVMDIKKKTCSFFNFKPCSSSQERRQTECDRRWEVSGGGGQGSDEAARRAHEYTDVVDGRHPFCARGLVRAEQCKRTRVGAGELVP